MIYTLFVFLFSLFLIVMFIWRVIFPNITGKVLGDYLIIKSHSDDKECYLVKYKATYLGFLKLWKHTKYHADEGIPTHPFTYPTYVDVEKEIERVELKRKPNEFYTITKK